jgi:hypothetical protein
VQWQSLVCLGSLFVLKTSSFVIGEEIDFPPRNLKMLAALAREVSRAGNLAFYYLKIYFLSSFD